MDWQSLMPQSAKTEAGTGPAADDVIEAGTAGGAADPVLFPLVPSDKSICTHSLLNENNAVPNVPNVPTKKAGNPLAGDEKSSVGGGGGSPDFFRARKTEGTDSYPLHPSSVVLLLAWCDRVGATQEQRAGELLDLCNHAPGEQVSRWHLACVEQGMEPWRVLSTVATMEGKDCTLCRHLTHRTYPEANGRRWFHWTCGRGYLLLECSNGSERIWLAPPECQSWEQWRPAGAPAQTVVWSRQPAP